MLMQPDGSAIDPENNPRDGVAKCTGTRQDGGNPDTATMPLCGPPWRPPGGGPVVSATASQTRLEKSTIKSELSGGHLVLVISPGLQHEYGLENAYLDLRRPPFPLFFSCTFSIVERLHLCHLALLPLCQAHRIHSFHCERSSRFLVTTVYDTEHESLQQSLT